MKRVLFCIILLVLTAGAAVPFSAQAAPDAPKPKPAAAQAPASTTKTTPTKAPSPPPPPADIPLVSPTQKKLNDAVALYDQGNWKEALAGLQKFVVDEKISPLRADALYYTGWCLFNLNRFEEGANAFGKLLKEYANSQWEPMALLKQAECYREAKKYDEAFATYQAFKQKYSRNSLYPYAFLGEGWTIYRKAATSKEPDYRPAREFVEKLIASLGPNAATKIDALFLLGQILSAQKDFDGARKIYREIGEHRNDPRATDGLFLAAEAMWDAKRYEDAISFYRRVQPKAAMLKIIDQQIARLKEQRGEYLRQNALGQYQDELSALAQRRDQFVAKGDLRAAALLRIGNCYQELGRPEEASVVYQYLLDLYPLDKLVEIERAIYEQALFRLSTAYAQRNQPAKAKAASELYDRQFPGGGMDSAYVRADSLFKQENYAEALKSYETVVKDSKNTLLLEDAQFRIPACYLGMTNYTKALESLKLYTEKYPKGKYAANTLFQTGRIHYFIAKDSKDPKFAQSELLEAAKLLENFRATYPKDEEMPLVTFQLAYIYTYLGNYERPDPKIDPPYPAKAVNMFHEVVTNWPTHTSVPESWYQIGQNELVRRRPKEAIEAFKTLVREFGTSTETQPAHELAPWAAYAIGGIYSGMKQPAEMIAAYQAYIDKYPNHERVGDALYTIATEYEAENKTAEAIATYRKIITRAAEAQKSTEEIIKPAIGAEQRIVGILEKKSPDEAVKDCEEFLAKFKNEPLVARAACDQIRDIYRRAKRIPDAYAKLDKISEQYQGTAHIRLAAYTTSLQLSLAEKDYVRANSAAQTLLHDPEKDRLPGVSYIAIGNAFIKTDRYQDARNIFEKLVSQANEDTKVALFAQLGLAQACVGLKDFDAAEKTLKKVAAVDPSNPDISLTQAKIFEGKGDGKAINDPETNQKAVEIYKTLISSKRSDIANEAAYRAGKMFYTAKFYGEATALFTRLIFASGPMADEALFLSGRCNEELKNHEGARRSYLMYLQRFPNGKFVKDTQERLKSLPAPATAPTR